MIHYLYVGHFEHDGLVVRFAKSTTDDVFKPVVRQPIDMRVVEELVQKLKGNGPNGAIIPEEWEGIWLEDAGYLVCDRFTRSRDALEFVAQLAERTGCEIFDYSSLSTIPPPQLTYAWPTLDDKLSVKLEK